jgi:hypothetical protein
LLAAEKKNKNRYLKRVFALGLLGVAINSWGGTRQYITNSAPEVGFNGRYWWPDSQFLKPEGSGASQTVTPTPWTK